MSEVSCTVQNSNSLSVGSIFELHCPSTSETWTGISPTQAEFKLADVDKYKLKLLKLEFTSKNEAVLTVTSYKPGSHTLNGVQVLGHDASGDHMVALSPISFSVVSVMDAKTPQEEAYGARGPIALSLPLWYWLVIAGAILTVIALVWYRIWKRSKKKKLLSKMQVLDVAQTPYFQFHHSVRKIQRDIGFAHEPTTDNLNLLTSSAQELSQAYKIYLARTFLIPTFFWSEKKILSDLKKHYSSIYEAHREGFKKSLAELSRAQNSGQLALKDVDQLLKMARDHVDQIEKMVIAQKGKKSFGGIG